jgi:hypothetical protein
VIIVDLFGGLGNQMFQYAMGQALSSKLSQEVHYATDAMRTFSVPRELELGTAFALEPDIVGREELSRLLGSWRTPPTIRRLLAKQSFRGIRGSKFVVEADILTPGDLANKAKDGAYLRGYWQSERYFQQHSDAIREAFRFKEGEGPQNRSLIDRITGAPSIGIHVRRGDYVTNPRAATVHGVLAKSYYVDAIMELRRRLPSARVFAFSDEPAWVEQYILKDIENTECVAHNRSSESFRDMQLMGYCDALVIANSSFSWWAAWLNARDEKIVIAPSKWYADSRKSSSSIVPSTWLRRENNDV